MYKTIGSNKIEDIKFILNYDTFGRRDAGKSMDDVIATRMPFAVKVSATGLEYDLVSPGYRTEYHQVSFDSRESLEGFIEENHPEVTLPTEIF